MGEIRPLISAACGLNIGCRENFPVGSSSQRPVLKIAQGLYLWHDQGFPGVSQDGLLLAAVQLLFKSSNRPQNVFKRRRLTKNHHAGLPVILRQRFQALGPRA